MIHRLSLWHMQLQQHVDLKKNIHVKKDLSWPKFITNLAVIVAEVPNIYNSGERHKPDCLGLSVSEKPSQ